MPKAKEKTGYLHGYTQEEQNRLYRQAQFLEQDVYEGVDFRGAEKIIEVGSGVGAQTEILARRFPLTKIECVDASSAQISTAKKRLAHLIRSKRVKLHQADALKLPFRENSFDGAFICWLLEHLPNPVAALKETRRVLRQNAVIHLNEPLNATLFMHPYSPATLKYWFEYNDHQWNMKGDPFVGAKLGNYLLAAGYQNIQIRHVIHHYDNRTPKLRAQFIDYWIHLLLSGAPALLKTGKVDAATVKEMRRELERLKDDPDSVFYDSFVHASAQAF